MTSAGDEKAAASLARALQSCLRIEGRLVMQKLTAVETVLITSLLATGISLAEHRRPAPPPPPHDAYHAGYGDVGAFQVRLGGFFPAGGGDVWRDNQEFFTFNVNDMNSAMLGLSVVRSATSWLEFGFNADVYDGSTASAERGVTDEFGFPVFHETRLRLLPITADLRIVPGGRRLGGGRGGYAPAPVFYFGGGLGLALWEYEESGEFVDFGAPGLPIYAGDFRATGVAMESHLLAGLELPLGPAWGLLFEGRYSWADDQLDNADFPDFGRLDLGGPSLFVGASFRF
jgi:hypothetical protein